MSDMIEFLQKRQFLDALTSDDLRKVMEKPIKGYVGFDPTADSLHLGNLVAIVLLKWLQHFGHTPVIILGGATARIGDPSGKSAERPLLDEKTIDSNTKEIEKIFRQILDFSNPDTMPIILNNNEWFSSISFIDFLRDIGKHMRLGSMIAKECVRSRMESAEGISFTEFSYQMLQSYDFHHLNHHHDVLLQMGGSDQWGNITAGIDLTRKLSSKTVYGFTYPLLTRSDGKKFGKSEGGAIWLSPDRCSPYQFYQYLYSIPDADVIKMFRMLTFLPNEEIEALEASMKQSDYKANTLQKRLAQEVTYLVHGPEGLDIAEKVTQVAAPGAKAKLDAKTLEAIASDFPSLSLSKKEVIEGDFISLLVKTTLASSKGEARRLIQNGGVYLNEERVDSIDTKLTEADIIEGRLILIGVGKKKKTLIRLT